MTIIIAYKYFLIIIIILLKFVSNSQSKILGQNSSSSSSSSSSVSAIFVFGDSTVDTGNNNYLFTVAKANFLPYGKDFPNHIPTGRFSNGLLLPDFLARYVGLKDFVHPYLDSRLSIEELKTGISFASSSTGYDPLTPTLLNVISLPKQLEYFREYKAKMEEFIGKEQTQLLVKNAIFLVSTAGTNDFSLNYDGFVHTRRKQYTLPDYAHLVQQYVLQLLQDLFDEGGRKFGVAGLLPLDCLPFIITQHSRNPITKRECVDTFSSINNYDSILKMRLIAMQRKYANQGSRIAFLDIREPLLDMIQHPDKYGVVEVSKGCCGSGLVEASFLCNPMSTICEDASKYVFWDSFHPTEAAYNSTFKALQSTLDYIIGN